MGNDTGHQLDSIPLEGNLEVSDGIELESQDTSENTSTSQRYTPESPQNPEYSTTDILLVSGLILLSALVLGVISYLIIKMVRLLKRAKTPTNNGRRWRILKVGYVVSSILIICSVFTVITILNYRETCVVESKTYTEKKTTYIKTGPRPGDNSSFNYEIPQTAVHTYCSNAVQREDGISHIITITVAGVFVASYFLALPRAYQHTGSPNKP